MQNLLDCQILIDGLDFIENKNCIARESLRYRFLADNIISVEKELKRNVNLAHLHTWFKWYNFHYCVIPLICQKTQSFVCGISIEEVDPIFCTIPISVEDLT